MQWDPIGEWGRGQLADFDYHQCLAARVGAAYASSSIDRSGRTEFNTIRVVDSGETLASLLPNAVQEYSVSIYAIDASLKYRGWSFTTEYYFRQISGFQGDFIPNLFDHGHWMQLAKFVVPKKLQLLTRWSRVVGESGTLGMFDQSSDEVAGGFVWYFREQHAKLTMDATYINGAPINSSALDLTPGALGWLARTQIQFSF